MASKVDPLDRPVTLRELLDAGKGSRLPAFMTRLANAIVAGREEASQTDFIRTRGSDRVFRVVSQPTRRVQVDDLVTVQARYQSNSPRVCRVSKINVPEPTTPHSDRWRAVAISPEDAARIEAALGPIV